MLPTIIPQSLRSLELSRPFEKVLLELFTIWPSVRGRFNFTNIARYSSYNERTLRRWFSRELSWGTLNCYFLSYLIPSHHELIAALDASFIPKSGKSTFGLGWFFNGQAQRPEKGLETSLLSVVDLNVNSSYAVEARQSDPSPKEHKKTAKKNGLKASVQQVLELWRYLPKRIRYLVADGAYANHTFVEPVCKAHIHIISKLRHDAALWLPYIGPQKGKGRPRIYGEKVNWSKADLTLWKDEGVEEDGVHLYSAVLWHKKLKRKIKVVMLRQKRGDKTTHVLLFSTDIDLGATDIVRYYRARFQIEFLFRDAKSSMGLNHCQARGKKALYFHWNFAFSALTIAKAQYLTDAPMRISIASHKQRAANQQLLHLFSDTLGIDWNTVKSNPNYHTLCNYGAIM